MDVQGSVALDDQARDMAVGTHTGEGRGEDRVPTRRHIAQVPLHACIRGGALGGGPDRRELMPDRGADGGKKQLDGDKGDGRARHGSEHRAASLVGEHHADEQGDDHRRPDVTSRGQDHDDERGCSQPPDPPGTRGWWRQRGGDHDCAGDGAEC